MTDLTTLRDALGADTLLPGDAGYEAVRPAYFGVGDPAAIVHPTTPEQVADALRLAQEHGLPVSVRSGGHGAKAFPNPDGLVIDMSGFDSIEVLPDGAVRVGSGATWGAVADALAPHGLVITSGDTRNVGVGGLALGGGMGWLVRSVGLTIDILEAVELVTVDGRQLTASAESEPELFWALRGGGGNFGVVTHFTFRPAALSAVVGGRDPPRPRRSRRRAHRLARRHARRPRRTLGHLPRAAGVRAGCGPERAAARLLRGRRRGDGSRAPSRRCSSCRASPAPTSPCGRTATSSRRP